MKKLTDRKLRDIATGDDWEPGNTMAAELLRLRKALRRISSGRYRMDCVGDLAALALNPIASECHARKRGFLITDHECKIALRGPKGEK